MKIYHNKNTVKAAVDRKPNPKKEKAFREVINFINSWVDQEAVFLPDAFQKGTNTWYFVEDYIKDDWNLDTEAIISDWKAEFDVPLEERERSPYGMDEWEPTDYLYNILVQVVGVPHSEADKMLLYK